ncbi:kinase-like domain-containing protein [Lasiosphaeria hispida]|uniref:Kinase-like domain-containing protein n=1 Tax=Lasiosphaeria hispida TaxID=260671 RepID=A0AAJ0H7U6_9PEZI|nr:kinase-like domain-containing protein [Lasiosphaeria hispida]
MFTPLTFGSKAIIYRKQLLQQHVLPVREKTELRPDRARDNAVYKVDLHPCCVHGEGSTLHPLTAVFKMMSPSDDAASEASWENELDIYTKLRHHVTSPDPTLISLPGIYDPSPFDYITETLGSFQQQKSDGTTVRTIILEIATEGNLRDFFQNNESLIRAREEGNKLALWDKLFRCLLQGLCAIHGVERTHQDIKESNIVVAKDEKASEGDSVPWLFKITDFGKASRCDKNGNCPNNAGNRAYMAPECCEKYPVDSSIPPKYPKEADIWALGCLMSNFLVLSELGKEGCKKFLQLRLKENRSGDLFKTGYDKGFHKNEGQRLECVEEMHREALQQYGDDLSGNRRAVEAASRVILTFMLQPDKSNRKSARGLLEEWGREVEALSRPSPSDSTAPNLPTQPDHGESHIEQLQTPIPERQPPELEEPPPQVGETTAATIITVRDVVAWQDSTKSRVEVKSRYPNLFQELNLVGHHTKVSAPNQLLKVHFLKPITRYPGRCHRILVDDSAGVNKTNAADTVQAIAKLVKHRAPLKDGVLLFFLSDPKEPYPLSSSRKLARVVKERPFYNVEDKLNICDWLKMVLDEKLSNPLSIYILTNGILPGALPDIAGPIEKSPLIHKNTLSIVFIRVGDDETGHGKQTLDWVAEKVREVVDKLDLEVNYHPIYVCSFEDHVGNIIMGRIRAGNRSPSHGGTSTRPSIAGTRTCPVIANG